MALSQGFTAAPVKTIQAAGANLFQVALAELGDATQWNRIAQLSGLVDPWLTGLVTLNIPPVDPSATGGIYANPNAA